MGLLPLNGPGRAVDDRRGLPVSYVSYWSQQDRARRAEVFRRRGRGQRIAGIAAALAMEQRDVQAILRSDRRRTS